VLLLRSSNQPGPPPLVSHRIPGHPRTAWFQHDDQVRFPAAAARRLRQSPSDVSRKLALMSLSPSGVSVRYISGVGLHSTGFIPPLNPRSCVSIPGKLFLSASSAFTCPGLPWISGKDFSSSVTFVSSVVKRLGFQSCAFFPPLFQTFVPTFKKPFFSILGKAQHHTLAWFSPGKKARNRSSFFFSGDREFASFSAGQTSLRLSSSTAALWLGPSQAKVRPARRNVVKN
jgi:hypothetical protein